MAEEQDRTDGGEEPTVRLTPPGAADPAVPTGPQNDATEPAGPPDDSPAGEVTPQTGEAPTGDDEAPTESGEDEAPTAPASVDADGDEDRLGADAEAEDDRGSDHDKPAAPPVNRRKTAIGAMIGLLVGLLGFALVVQVRNNATDPTLASAREADLLQILQDLDSRQQRLQSDIGDLEQLQRELQSSAQGNQAALEQAKKRADELGILAGTLPAEGPGLTISFRANPDPIRAIDVLDAVQELRNAGAEAMQITGANGISARIIVSSYFTDAGNGNLNVDGQVLTGPYVITAIGDPSTMDKAMRIPGGVVALVTSHGGNVIVGEPGTVKVTTLHAPATLEYAKPAS